MKGKIEGIISNNSTDSEEVMLYPITVAEAVHFNDGKTLEEKINSLPSSTTPTTPTEPSYTVIPNKWQNKTIYCFGDSITAGGYPNTIKSILGAYVTNKGSSGGTYERDFTNITSLDLSFVDAITVMTGHNGGAGNLTLATSGLLNVTNTNDYSSFPANYYGGIGKIIEYIRNRYPNIKIYLLNLHYTLRNNTSMDCKRALFEIGSYYSVPVINVFDNVGIGVTNLSDYSSDGTHLDLQNNKGQTLIGECVAYQMMFL